MRLSDGSYSTPGMGKGVSDEQCGPPLPGLTLFLQSQITEQRKSRLVLAPLALAVLIAAQTLQGFDVMSPHRDGLSIVPPVTRRISKNVRTTAA